MPRNNLLSNYLATFSDDFPSLYFNPITSGIGKYGFPAINIKEFDDHYEVVVSVAGIDPNKIKLELVDRLLTISYDHEDNAETKTEDGQILREEFRHYSFSRSITLPKNVDENNIKAKNQNGLLTITLMKTPQAKPRQIKID
jgi:HSP20 family protein